MRMPRRRWTDFPAGLRRVRISSGMTQNALAETLNVDQATISRWERGAQVPDEATQARLRDLLFRGRAVSDARLYHYVRTSMSLVVLMTSTGRFLARSESARALGMPEQATLEDLMTPSLRESWNAAVGAGFFRGEIASIQVVFELAPADGQQPIFVEGAWHPVALADGSFLLLAESRVLGPTAYEAARALGTRITPLEEIL
jgi:transcriptional regulator with XRE-family HTH domain